MYTQKDRKEQHSDIKDILRYVEVASCSAALVFSLASPPTFKREPKRIELSEKKELISFDLHVGRGIPDSQLFMGSDGRWDFDKLKGVQEDYFAFIKSHYQDTVFSGMPYSIIKLMPTIKKISDEYDMNPTFIALVIRSESFGCRYAVGKHGEYGLMQINPNSYPKEVEMGYTRIFEPEVNIEIGTAILRNYLRRFDNNYRRALEAYNEGPHPVERGRIKKDAVRYASRILNAEKDIDAAITIRQ